MNITQALSLTDSFCSTSATICDHCNAPTTTSFNWDMVNTLCFGCFVAALYQNDVRFPVYLKHVADRQGLLKLCQAYQLDGLHFPPGPTDDPLLFFGLEAADNPSYQTKGGAMDATQQSFLHIERYDDLTHRPVTIRELPPEERPVNRLNRYGPTAVSNAELLAALIQTPNALHVASLLLAKHKGLLGLARASNSELLDTPGLGPARVAQLKAALELGRRVMIASPDDKIQVKSPADAANLLMMEMGNLEQEHMRLILLDSKNHIVDTPTIYVGSLSMSVIRVGELFREAIRQNCASIIVIHNHPSGDPTPSSEDVAVTAMIIQAGKLLDIEVLDHLIIGRQRYVSLKERGLGFN